MVNSARGDGERCPAPYPVRRCVTASRICAAILVGSLLAILILAIAVQVIIDPMRRLTDIYSHMHSVASENACEPHPGLGVRLIANREISNVRYYDDTCSLISR